MLRISNENWDGSGENINYNSFNDVSYVKMK